MSNQKNNAGAIHCYVGDEEHIALTEFIEYHGISLSGLMVALCREVDEHHPDDEDHPLGHLVKTARRVDADRRRRGRPKEVKTYDGSGGLQAVK
jgi:hypothetical protein